VILCTDGVANNGITEAGALLKRIHDQAEKGVDLIALGFGMGNYNDILLQKLADEGDGQYAYIDDFPEAERFFLRDLTQVLEVVARDAKTQVAFDPAKVERYRLLGYEKRDVADEKFRDDSVDGGEVNSGHAVTVLYEVKLKAGATGDLGAVHLRYADPVSRKVTEVRETIGGAQFRAAFTSASPRFRLTALVARFAEHLRKSYWAKGERLQRVLDAAEDLPASLVQEEQTREFLEMLGRAIRLQTPERQ
jgi:Ca-activated chloride channel homolog